MFDTEVLRAAAPVLAQGPDLNQLALEWIRGRYASPVLCEFEGETIRGALKTMGYQGVTDVRQGKYFEMSLDASSREEAESQVREIATRVLSNPVIETFEVELLD